MKFPERLRAAAADCNRARVPLIIAVVILGLIALLVMFALWRTALKAGMTELTTILGPDAAAQVEAQLTTMRPGPEGQQVMMDVIAEIQKKFDAMPTEARDETIGRSMVRVFSVIGPVLGGFILLSAILKLWASSFFLLAGLRKGAGFGKLAGEAITWMLPMLGMAILVALLFIAWALGSGIVGLILGKVLHPALGGLAFAVLGFGGLIVIGPRLAFSPVILLQDNGGIVGSLKKSYAATKGKWFRIVGNLIGAAAMIWIALFIVQFLLNLIISVLPSSPANLLLGQLMIFATLLGKAYQAIFLVRLKQTIK